jgi:hypothetical protein
VALFVNSASLLFATASSSVVTVPAGLASRSRSRGQGTQITGVARVGSKRGFQIAWLNRITERGENIGMCGHLERPRIAVVERLGELINLMTALILARLAVLLMLVRN